MSELVIVAIVLAWFGLGVWGVWLGNRRMDEMYPTLVNHAENAVNYVWAFAGPCSLLGTLIWIAGTRDDRL